MVLEMSEGGACGVSHRTTLGLVIKDLCVRVKIFYFLILKTATIMALLVSSVPLSQWLLAVAPHSSFLAPASGPSGAYPSTRV